MSLRLICSINSSNNSANLWKTLIPSSSPKILSSFHYKKSSILAAVNAGTNHESCGPDLLRRPIIISPPSTSTTTTAAENLNVVVDEEFGDSGEDERSWISWEDLILKETVPLVGFMRMILHSRKYQSGDRLSPEHETIILEKLLQNHPEYENKIGCGVDYITIGYHPQFVESRCLFIVRKDGELVDFSYWKCIKGLIKKNYPQYAESFILKHFRRRNRYD